MLTQNSYYIPWVIWILCVISLLYCHWKREKLKPLTLLHVVVTCSFLQGFTCFISYTFFSMPMRKWSHDYYWPEMAAKSQMVTGKLSHRLGTIVTISGEVIDHPDRKWGRSDEKILLKVEYINGRPRSKAISFEFEVAQGIKEEIETPKIGDKFLYTGYELIRQEGVDGEANQYLQEPDYGSHAPALKHKFIILKDDVP